MMILRRVLVPFLVLLACLPASARQAKAINISSPRGAMILAMERDSSGSLLLLTESSGIWATSDMGRTWSNENAGLPDSTMCALTVMPSGRSIVATGKGLYARDRGQRRWRHLSAPDSSYRQVFALGGTRVVALEQSGGLRVSDDEGLRWVRRPNEVSHRRYITTPEIVPGPEGILYAPGADAVVYRTSDAGISWSALPAPVDPGEINDLVLGKDGELYVSCHKRGAYVLRQGGERWEPATWGIDDVARIVRVRGAGLLVSKIVSDRLWYIASEGMPREIAVRGDVASEGLVLPDGTMLLNAYTALLESKDQGRTWRQFSRFTAWDLGSFDESVEVEVDEDGKVLASTGLSAFRSEDHGKSWQILSLMLGGFEAAASLGGGMLGLWYGDDGCQLSTDDGKTFHAFPADPNGPVVESMVRDRSGRLLAVTRPRRSPDGSRARDPRHERNLPSRLQRSVDGGMTWQPVGDSTTDLSMLRRIGRHLYGLVGSPPYYYSIRRSSDDGATWIDLSPGIRPNGFTVADGDTVIVATDIGAFLWDPRDGTRRLVKEGLPSERLTSVLSIPGKGVIGAGPELSFLPRGSMTWVPARSDLRWPTLLAADDSFLYLSAREPMGKVREYRFNGVRRLSIAELLRAVRPAPPADRWWEELPSVPSSNVRSFLPMHGGRLMVHSSGLQLFLLSPGAKTWTVVGPPPGIEYEGWVFSAAVEPGTDRLIAVTLGCVASTTDQGATWVREPFPKKDFLGSIVPGLGGESFYFDREEIGHRRPGDTVWTKCAEVTNYLGVTFLLPQEDGIVYVGLWGSGLARLERDRRTVRSINGDLLDPLTNTYCATGMWGQKMVDALIARPRGELFAAREGRLYRSFDRGNRWAQVRSVGDAINALVSTKRGDLYAATNLGVHRSTDGGGSWHAINGGLDVINAQKLVLGDDGHLYLMTADQRAYRSIRPVK